MYGMRHHLGWSPLLIAVRVGEYATRVGRVGYLLSGATGAFLFSGTIGALIEWDDWRHLLSGVDWGTY